MYIFFYFFIYVDDRYLDLRELNFVARKNSTHRKIFMGNIMHLGKVGSAPVPAQDNRRWITGASARRPSTISVIAHVRLRDMAWSSAEIEVKHSPFSCGLTAIKTPHAWVNSMHIHMNIYMYTRIYVHVPHIIYVYISCIINALVSLRCN